MNRRRILYLLLALALLLAPMAAYAAPVPSDFAATGASAASPQPPAPVAGANGSRSGAPDAAQPMQYTSPASFSEGFNDITILPGWFRQNNSAPGGLTGWFQGNSGVFPAQAGPTNSYIGANYSNTAGTNTISNWLLTPELNLADGDTLSFWTRTVPSPAFPDRLELRLSLAGASTNVGTAPTDVGDFTTLLLTINPTLTTAGYPTAWTQFTVTLSSIPGGSTGRFAFRYFVTNGGPDGNNSDYIGIDTVEFSGIPLAVTLASFTAEAQANQVQVTWETVSELHNAGFNLYRNTTPDTVGDLLVYVPSQAPGSAQGFAYSYDDADVEPGQTYWYWLEDIDFSGATTLHGPVSAEFTVPTAVTVNSMSASPLPASALPLAGAALALLLPLASGLAVARRRRA